MGMVVFPVLVNRHSGNDRIKHHKGQSMVQPCWLGLACAVVAVTGARGGTTWEWTDEE